MRQSGDPIPAALDDPWEEPRQFGVDLRDTTSAGQAFTKQVADFFVQQGQLDRALDSYDFAIDASLL